MFDHYLLINGEKRRVILSDDELTEAEKAEHDAWWAAELVEFAAAEERLKQDISYVIRTALSRR